MSTIVTTVRRVPEEVDYASSDGQPIAETPLHVNVIFVLKQCLESFFAKQLDVYIGCDMFWYWEEGNKKACKAPDVMVIPGVGRADRNSFFSWRENGAVPAVIFEIASAGTWEEDLHEKYAAYERLGVREYFIFDPEGVYIDPWLRGFQLLDGKYVELRLSSDGALTSEQLGLKLVGEDRMLRLINAATGVKVLTQVEEVVREREQAERERDNAKRERDNAKRERDNARQEKENAERERSRAQQADAKVADLTAEIVRLKAELESMAKKDDA